MIRFQELFSDELKKKFLTISSLNYSTVVLSILISIFTVRATGIELFGRYQYFLAIVEFSGVFYTSFDRIINRFSFSSDREAHISMVASALAVHVIFTTLSFLIILFILHQPILATWFFKIKHKSNESIVLYLVFLITFFQGLLNTLTTYFNGIRKIQLSQKISLLLTILNLIFVFLVFVLKIEQIDSLIILLSIKIILICIFLIYSCSYDLSFSKDIFKVITSPRQLRSSFHYVIKNYFKDYAFYFQINEIFGFFKDRLAVLILGQQGIFTGAAFYEVIKNIISIPRKFFVQLFNIFIPQIVYSLEKNEELFSKRFHYFCRMQFISTIVAGALIILCNGLIIKVYAFDNLITHYYLTFFECLSLAMAAWANCNNFALELAKDTKSLMIASMGRAMVIFVLTPILIKFFRYLGPAAATLISCMLLICFLSYRTKNNKLWNFKNNFALSLIFTIAAICMYFLISVSYNFSVQYLNI